MGDADDGDLAIVFGLAETFSLVITCAVCCGELDSLKSMSLVAAVEEMAARGTMPDPVQGASAGP